VINIANSEQCRKSNSENERVQCIHLLLDLKKFVQNVRNDGNGCILKRRVIELSFNILQLLIDPSILLIIM
jgi:hypothetical protein